METGNICCDIEHLCDGGREISGVVPVGVRVVERGKPRERKSVSSQSQSVSLPLPSLSLPLFTLSLHSFPLPSLPCPPSLSLTNRNRPQRSRQSTESYCASTESQLLTDVRYARKSCSFLTEQREPDEETLRVPI